MRHDDGTGGVGAGVGADAGADLEAALDDAAALCARNGAQLTALRRTVLGLLLRAEGPSTAYQLLERLQQVRKGAAPPTVYRALEFLLAHKLVHRVERLNAFIPCMDAEHGHAHPVQFLICTSCGTVAEIEDHAVSAALTHAAAQEGFRPARATVELDGTCAACNGATAAG